ncbi:MAG TPA: Rieske (2Fe-2S) protein [Planctomycetota bacterium]|nr:Rieske (2Fe-2S) protein [Planctomycetota bacterium]
MIEAQGSPAPAGSDPILRRPALARLLKVGAATWVVGLATPAVSYLWPAQREGPESHGVFQAGPLNELPVGGSKLIQAAGKPILLIRLAETEFRAFSAVCTHLGCLVQWRHGEKDVFCPCHGGRFTSEGQVAGGPPPRPLTPYAVAVIGGEVQIRLSAE